MNENQTRMLDYLSQSSTWVTAGELADHLGVTARSVRSYVTRLKASAHPLTVIESGPTGYRLNREAYAAFLSHTAVSAVRATTGASEAETPQERLYHLVRRLTDSAEGLDVYELGAVFFVSESTIEADLGKVRLLLPDTGLTLVRTGNIVTLTGDERDRRRLLSRMFREEGARGLIELEAIQREFSSESLSTFKTDLLAMLDAQGYFVNEYSTHTVLLHLAIAVDRVIRLGPRVPLSSDAVAAESPSTPPALAGLTPMAERLAPLISLHFGVELEVEDLDYLAMLLISRVITPGHDQPSETLVENFVRADDLSAVRRIARQASTEYLVDLADEDFLVRLTLHVRNLINRAQNQSYSQNPLTRSIKTAYPMIYELAVYIASELQREEQIVINDDEIAYIAMHVGAHVEQQSHREELVRCVIVSPNYYDMHLLLRERIERVLGDVLEVTGIVTRTDVEWDALDAEVILTTIDPPRPSDRTVVIQPFLTEGDIERVRAATSRVRRLRRRAQITDQLRQFFDESLFVRNFYAPSEAAMIRALGDRMRAQGIIDQGYIDQAIEREQMSSTAFTDNLAVPHAMAMTATRTSIAIAVNDAPMNWGDNRVNLVALIAFNESERASFQGIFDQFVEVFAERSDVQQLIKRSVDYSSFIEELVHLIDS